MTPETPLLQVRDLRVAFGAKEVVHGVSFEIRAGEKFALVGESGSGKTVSALSLLRLTGEAKISGQALLDGRDLLQLSERELRGVRGSSVAMIFQEPMSALNPLMAVGAQVAEVLMLKQGLSKAQSARAAIELFAATGIPEPERRAGSFPHQLSGGQRQRAMIAMALASRPKLLLADEPTTALDVSLRGQILELLADLQRQSGMAMLLITHDLLMVRRFADRVAVMEQGHLVEHGETARIFGAPEHAYTRRLIASTPRRDVVEEAVAAGAPVAALAESLRVSYPVPLPGVRGWFRKGEFVAVKGASFRLCAGRTLGVVGESGSGKSTLAQALLGLLPSTGGLQVAGQHWQQPAQHNSAHNRQLRQRVQVVFQDPFSSLSPRLTVQEIVGEGLRVHSPGLTEAERRARVLAMLTEVGLTEAQFPGLLARYPHEFSGGQRQRLAVARALILEPGVLVLDEPTSALDVTIQQQVLQLLQRLQKERGLAYLLITHDMAVVRAMAHEVLVMKDGEVLEAGDVRQVLDAPRHPYTRRLVEAALMTQGE
ncbi:MAG: microcin ABC transporter ATP-binding protein [Comamonas sp. SCN 67-35]|uniref:ABC transporter ATP-binding protein n=1 Tax=unclassified Comamonas TaxID=2638500 RepID=UPI00086F7DC2|nr:MULTISPECIES: dipeptide ABC transporter ATP-binding protein [unclassified Comamonas]MBN9331454.1 ABC transporter ATP-binding protein [Comamonas sp.]ODU37336.1 MAG: microcin ABC transporter ATP-binding protein [Comamonas sp. SCN 67-35]OJX01005.1 MAG: microcin ABC transporter ATP-binding protein [Burkholderiales bacterium 66-26]